MIDRLFIYTKNYLLVCLKLLFQKRIYKRLVSERQLQIVECVLMIKPQYKITLNVLNLKITRLNASTTNRIM